VAIHRSPLVGLAITALAVATGGGAGLALAGEVRGVVTLGPMCPGPSQIGKECPPTPIATTIDVFRSPNDPSMPGKPYRRIKSDNQGRFQISLAPDTYWFVPHVPKPYGKIPSAKPRQVVVTAGITQVTLVVDTGMR
jgi:hypothetical protein